MRRARLGLFLLAAAWLVILTRGDETAGPASLPPSSAVHDRTDGVARPAVPAFRGAGSCSATACHGRIAKTERSLSGVQRNEHTTWVTSDAHSRAYQVLFDRRSVDMVGRLADDPVHHLPAHEDSRCLACHTTPRTSSLLVATSWMNSDSVGCESCHGASSLWLGPHTIREEWSALSRDAKAQRGFNNTKDLVRRAELCAGCHVGRRSDGTFPDRDVNHDLVAAGHPRLNFELSAFLANMPAHWDEKEENADPVDPRKPAADFPARAWMIGRLVTLKSSLELLEQRGAAAGKGEQRGAAAGKGGSPWPEFAEYSCFSCHHDLRDQAWRRTARNDGTVAGSPRWGSWVLPQACELIARLGADPVAQGFKKSLTGLTQEMAEPFPDPKVVERQSRETARLLGQCLVRLAPTRFDGDDVRRLIDQLDRNGARDHVDSWDQAAQLYLALVPLRQTWVARDPARESEQLSLKLRLKDLHGKLTFPKGFDSPNGFEPGLLRIDQGR